MNEMVSVIVPVYNGEKFLRRCMESLKKQTLENMEILLIDDGSTDKTAEICAEYAARMPHVRVVCQKNQGIAAARNTGIAESRGGYIGFCDADDFAHPAMYETLYRILKKEDADISVCGYVRTADTEERLPEPSAADSLEICTSGEAFEKLLKGEGELKSYLWNKLYRRELFEGIRYPDGKNYEDQFVTYQLVLKAKKIAVTGWRGYCYVINPDSITNRKWNRKELEYLEAWEEIWKRCRRDYPELSHYAAEQLVSAAVYNKGRMRKANISDELAERMIQRIIREYGKGYQKSRIAAATGKRKLLVLAWRIFGGVRR